MYGGLGRIEDNFEGSTDCHKLFIAGRSRRQKKGNELGRFRKLAGILEGVRICQPSK